MVWSECRRCASKFFTELAEIVKTKGDSFSALSVAYLKISQAMQKAGNRELPAAEQASLLSEARDLEADAVGTVEHLLSSAALAV